MDKINKAELKYDICIGDGITDNTENIKRIQNEGGIIYLPEAEYIMTETGFKKISTE